ncbi:MAG: PHP domain-containing protein, partial [Pelagibacterales bacterium]|nr:PHP domain-containing protein [Pelagibacterales bacterium]
MNLKDVFFNHIKIHTQYSICEGAVKIADLADYLKKNPVNAIGISDSLNLSGALEFSELVSKAGVHPIIGTQINLNFQEIIGKISLIAKSETGYKNLINLSSNSYLKVNKDQVPQINLKELLSNAQDLIILFGGKNTLASELILNNQEKLFTNLITEFKNNFKDNLYFEIQRHGEIGEKTIENFLIEKSSINKIPLIATHEVFYLSKETYEAHDAYICVGQKTYVDEKSRLTYSEEHYFKSNDEMVEIFKDLPDALENN